MPQNTPQAVRPNGSGTQAIVRSKRAHLKPPAGNCHEHPPKSTKTRGSYLAAPKILRIQQRYLNGQNKTEIAREEKCDRETVTRVVQFPEVQNFIAQMQQEFFGLIPDAMAAVRYALRVEKNPMIGLAILERTGVTAYRGERMKLPESTASESGYERQARLVASVMLEAHEKLGVDLPEDVAAALKKDADFQEAAKMLEAKPSRR
jgi:hypothetical protein